MVERAVPGLQIDAAIDAGRVHALDEHEVLCRHGPGSAVAGGTAIHPGSGANQPAKRLTLCHPYRIMCLCRNDRSNPEPSDGGQSLRLAPDKGSVWGIFLWWGDRDSNPDLTVYKTVALTVELSPHRADDALKATRSQRVGIHVDIPRLDHAVDPQQVLGLASPDEEADRPASLLMNDGGLIRSAPDIDRVLKDTRGGGGGGRWPIRSRGGGWSRSRRGVVGHLALAFPSLAGPSRGPRS